MRINFILIYRVSVLAPLVPCLLTLYRVKNFTSLAAGSSVRAARCHQEVGVFGGFGDLSIPLHTHSGDNGKSGGTALPLPWDSPCNIYASCDNR